LIMSNGAENELRTGKLRSAIISLLTGFDRALLDEELALWYRMEPDPEAREMLFHAFNTKWGRHGTQPGLVGLLEVAAQEEDEYLANRAKNYLEIARRQLEELKEAKEEEPNEEPGADGVGD